MITELLPGIFNIFVPLPGNPLKNLNSFFIRGRNRSLLVDTGFNLEASRSALTQGLEEIGADMDQTDIFLTHLHSDHIGLAQVIAKPGSRIYISSIDKELMLKFRTPAYRREVDNRFLRFGFTEEELKENRETNPAMVYLPEKAGYYTGLEDDAVLDLGNRKLRCIMTPGHTPGHMCLYDEEAKILFSGDHIIFDISPNITSWPSLPDSLGCYLKSLRKISGLSLLHTFSSHRQPEGDCLKRIKELEDHHEARTEEALAVVKRIGRATVYEIASGMTWSIRAKTWQDFPIDQKWFAVGEAHSHLEYLYLRSRLVMTEAEGLLYYEAAR